MFGCGIPAAVVVLLIGLFVLLVGTVIGLAVAFEWNPARAWMATAAGVSVTYGSVFVYAWIAYQMLEGCP